MNSNETLQAAMTARAVEWGDREQIEAENLLTSHAQAVHDKDLVDDERTLEDKLYNATSVEIIAFCLDTLGLKGEVSSVEYLTKEYVLFCEKNNLEQLSADELILQKDLSGFQKEYIEEFIARWNEVN